VDEIAIQAEGLSKRYRLGSGAHRYGRLTESLATAFAAPFKKMFRAGSGSPAEEGSHWALKDVSFDVKVGQAVGIIGRNGAGKTTLLKLLSRITEPTEGRAILRGRVGSLLEVGTGFHPELTGKENVYLNGAILGMSRAEINERFDQIVEFAEVERFLDTPVKRYSSGMQVRLAFAVAAHLEPEILIVDEVLAVGDERFQAKCMDRIRGIRAGGTTIFFVSHAMEQVAALCDRVLVLDQGHVRFDGSVLDLVATAAGRVWLADAPDPAARASWRTGIGRHRNVGDTAPPGAEPAEPTLEDAYLLLLGDRAVASAVAS